MADVKASNIRTGFLYNKNSDYVVAVFVPILVAGAGIEPAIFRL